MSFNYTKDENENLIVLDPIYGEIVVPHSFSIMILTREMQRLNDISQNGFSYLEFKGLEKNNRLNHSLGAFYIMQLILQKLESNLKHYGIELSQENKDIALSSILLHDIGHGPFSHSLEVITDYSHEKRTADILLGETEISQVLEKLYGKEKINKIINFINKTNNPQSLEKDSFTKLLSGLVSHQLDADRIDYLIRDSFYAGLKSPIDIMEIISNLNVVLNNSQDYELLISKKGLASIENILIQRFQMYRDVYCNPVAKLGDYIFKRLVKGYKENKELHSLDVPQNFKKLIEDSKLSDLENFLEISETDFKEAFQILAKNNIDPIVAYLSDFNNIDEYILIENDISKDKIENYLREIFNSIDLSDTFSIIEIETKVKLYKIEEGLKIDLGNKIVDLSECTNLIKTQEILELNYMFFNPEILRMELGLSREEFEKYESELKKMIDDLNKKTEEFELKYILKDENKNLTVEEIAAVFSKNGFKIISAKDKLNNDEYYDTADLILYQKGGSLRIRDSKQNGVSKYQATYKMPLDEGMSIDEGKVCSSRDEIEEQIPNLSFEIFRTKMEEKSIPIDFDKVIKRPILNCTTNRQNIILEKNGIQVCLSFDQSVYTNHFLNEISTNDLMIEIEAIGKSLSERIILKEIHGFITSHFKGLSICNQSKYERGINSTVKLNDELNPQQSTNKTFFLQPLKIH